MTDTRSDRESDEDRELCPDGACIGLIGEDARCKLCGTKGSGAPRPAAGGIPADVPEEAEGIAGASAAAGAASEDGIDGDEGEDARELCVDGRCIGLIGPEGRCKMCGLAADPPPA